MTEKELYKCLAKLRELSIVLECNDKSSVYINGNRAVPLKSGILTSWSKNISDIVERLEVLIPNKEIKVEETSFE